MDTPEARAFWGHADTVVASKKKAISAPQIDMPGDDEEWEEEIAVDALQGSGGSSGSSEELSGLLLELVVNTTRAAILLMESDEDEIKLVSGRLRTLKTLTEQLPETGRPTRKLGFKTGGKGAQKRPKRKRKSARRRS